MRGLKFSRGCPKNSWKEAVDRNSVALGIDNCIASFRRHLREAMDHN